MSHLSRILALGILGWSAVPAAGAQPRPSPAVRDLIAGMPLERQVAQLVMPWLLGNYVGFDADGLAQARGWIDSLQVGGIIISIGSPIDVASKLNFLQRRSKVPLLVAADLEGGAAFRFPGATPFPTNMGIAATGVDADARSLGRITALEGRAVGVHLNFAPVADINNNPRNPIINTRAFGSDPIQVGRLVTAAVEATRDAGMLATVKHFPGHGDTETDSHISLPVIRADWRRLSALELYPFKLAIKAGVDVVMSAHVALPSILGDSTRPATLSPFILTDVLRDSLGFDGLVVTDALDMGALVAAYGGGESAVRAFLAGSDLLLMPANPADAIRAMVAAVRSGRISRARLRSSLVRLLTIKEKLGLFERRTVSLDRVGTVVGQQAFLDTARSIARRSLVLVRDSLGILSNIRSFANEVALVTYGEPTWTTELPRHLIRRGHRINQVRLYPMSGPASYDSARVALARAPNAIFSVNVRVSSGSGTISMPPPLVELIETASLARPTLLISFGSPYLMNQTPGVAGLLLAWQANPLTEEAVANALSGTAITGRLPTDLPGGYHPGDGITRSATSRVDATSRR